MLNSFEESIHSLKQQDSLISISSKKGKTLESDVKKQTKIRKEISNLNRSIEIVTFFKGAYFPPSGSSEFVQNIHYFNTFFRNQNNYPEEIVDSARALIQKRIVKYNEIAQVFESMISSKDNSLIDSSYYKLWNSVDTLLKLTGSQMPQTLVRVGEQMVLHDKIVLGLNKVETRLDSLIKILIELDKPLSINQFNEISGEYYNLFNILNESDSALQKIRKFDSDHMKNRFPNVKTSVMLIRPVIDSIKVILPKVNTLMDESKYKEIVQLLNEKQNLGILQKCYSVVDSFLIEQQSLNIAKAIQDNETETAVNLLHNLCYAKFGLNPYEWQDVRYKKTSAMIEQALNKYRSDTTKVESSFTTDMKQMKEWIEFQSKSKELSQIELKESDLKAARFLSDNGQVFHQGELTLPQNSKWLMLRPTEYNHSDSLVEVALSTKKASDPVLDEIENNPSGLKMIRNGKITEKKAFYFRNIPGFVPGYIRKAYTIHLLPNYLVSTIGSDEIVIKNINPYGFSEPVIISGSDTLDIPIEHYDGLYFKWIGDINNDGLIDIIVDAYPHYNNSVHAVLISTLINGKRKFKVVAAHSTTGC